MWTNPKFPVGLGTFTEKFIYGKLHFCSVELITSKQKIKKEKKNEYTTKYVSDKFLPLVLVFTIKDQEAIVRRCSI